MTVLTMRVMGVSSCHSRVMVICNGELSSTGLRSAAEQVVHINFAVRTWDHLCKQVRQTHSYHQASHEMYDHAPTLASVFSDCISWISGGSRA